MVDKLFIAGIMPGMLMVLLLAVYCIRQGVKLTGPKSRFDLRKILKAIHAAAWEIPLPFLIIGGIYGGIFTVTELAAVTAAYVLLVEVFVYRDVGLGRDLPQIIRESMILVGGILVILGAALGLTSYLVEEQIPMRALELVQSFIKSPLLFLVFLNIGLLIVGCLMDIFSAIIVVVPLITPIAAEFGIDPVHLGVIFLANLGIGYSTPPVGLNLFIASFRFKRPIIQLYRATLPFLLILLISLALITYLPFLSLALL